MEQGIQCALHWGKVACGEMDIRYAFQLHHYGLLLFLRFFILLHTPKPPAAMWAPWLRYPVLDILVAEEMVEMKEISG